MDAVDAVLSTGTALRASESTVNSIRTAVALHRNRIKPVLLRQRWETFTAAFELAKNHQKKAKTNGGIVFVRIDAKVPPASDSDELEDELEDEGTGEGNDCRVREQERHEIDDAPEGEEHEVEPFVRSQRSQRKVSKGSEPTTSTERAKKNPKYHPFDPEKHFNWIKPVRGD
jgi:hypothetical protein